MYGHPEHGWRLPGLAWRLTVDPDDGAAPDTPSLTLVAPSILQGDVSEDQLGLAALAAQLAPG